MHRGGHRGGEARIHLPDRGGEHDGGTRGGGLAHIALEIPWVVGQILGHIELQRIHEDGDGHDVALGGRPVHQRPVAGVQGPHGGNEAHPASHGPLALEGSGESAGRGDHPHGAISVPSHSDCSFADPFAGCPSDPGWTMSGVAVTGGAVAAASRRARATPAS